MPETIRGTIEKTYHSSPGFSAGVLAAEDGRNVRFAGKLCANVGDVVALVGRWKHDPKYGRQFAVESLSYELPETTEGLVQYLAQHPAFTGIGEITARKIVTYAASAANLDRIIRQDLEELHRQLRIPRATLESLREAWIANSAENEVRSYLAGFGLTPHQVETLLKTFGNSIVGVLRNDPYQLIRYVDGYGFKRVDKIARAMGTPKDHAGRIAAGLLYVVGEEIAGGHTWINGADLIDKGNELLLLDTLDSRDVIRSAGEGPRTRGRRPTTGSIPTRWPRAGTAPASSRASTPGDLQAAGPGRRHGRSPRGGTRPQSRPGIPDEPARRPEPAGPASGSRRRRTSSARMTGAYRGSSGNQPNQRTISDEYPSVKVK